MVEWLIEFFRSSYTALYIATFIVASFLFISGLDDLFIDMYYWFHHLFAKKKFNKYTYASADNLHEIPEKPVAIYVPAWHEQDVIDKMLVNACQTIQYKNYDIFVGVYPNDRFGALSGAERERIGRELHDSIIQSLHAAGLVLEDAATMMDQDPSYAKTRISVVNRSLGLTIRDIRAFILDLHHNAGSSNWREDLGELVREFRLQTLINAEFRAIGTAQWEPADNKGQEILSIAREALSNSAQHSQATLVRVTLTCGEHIELVMADNGIGMNVAEHVQQVAGEHLGLANMRTRAELIGGTLTLESAPGRGTTVRLIVPNGQEDKGERDDAQDHARR